MKTTSWEKEALMRRLASLEARIECIEFDLYCSPPKVLERPEPNSSDTPVCEEG